jgi:hypothetical protein
MQRLLARHSGLAAEAGAARKVITFFGQLDDARVARKYRFVVPPFSLAFRGAAALTSTRMSILSERESIDASYSCLRIRYRIPDIRVQPLPRCGGRS